jgi:hypothetical protein
MSQRVNYYVIDIQTTSLKKINAHIIEMKTTLSLFQFMIFLGFLHHLPMNK